MFSVRGAFTFTVIRTVTWSHSYPQQYPCIITPLCAEREGSSSEWHCLMWLSVLHLSYVYAILCIYCVIRSVKWHLCLHVCSEFWYLCSISVCSTLWEQSVKQHFFFFVENHLNGNTKTKHISATIVSCLPLVGSFEHSHRISNDRTTIIIITKNE